MNTQAIERHINSLKGAISDIEAVIEDLETAMEDGDLSEVNHAYGNQAVSRTREVMFELEAAA